MMKSLIGIALFFAGLLLFSGCDSDDPVVIPEPPERPLVDYVVYSSEYLNHRFFKLDLPAVEAPGGRLQGDQILVESIKVFQWLPVGPPEPGDITNVAVYVDSLGFRYWDGINFHEPHIFGRRWREITPYSWDVMFDPNGELIGVDLGNEISEQDVLAVIYEVRLADGSIVKVGDFPGNDIPQQEISGGDGLYYRMKLLKAPVTDREPHTFQYVLRNIYSLGFNDIDVSTFALRIERNIPGASQPQQDESGLDYIRIFGLDRDDPQRNGYPDGLADFWDPYIFDLARGLLKFPLDFPRPFAPGGQFDPYVEGQPGDVFAESIYAAYADTSGFVWNPSFLRQYQTWQIYDPRIFPSEYPQYAVFKIIATHGQPDIDLQ